MYLNHDVWVVVLSFLPRRDRLVCRCVNAHISDIVVAGGSTIFLNSRATGKKVSALPSAVTAVRVANGSSLTMRILQQVAPTVKSVYVYVVQSLAWKNVSTALATSTISTVRLVLRDQELQYMPRWPFLQSLTVDLLGSAMFPGQIITQSLDIPRIRHLCVLVHNAPCAQNLVRQSFWCGNCLSVIELHFEGVVLPEATCFDISRVLESAHCLQDITLDLGFTELTCAATRRVSRAIASLPSLKRVALNLGGNPLLGRGDHGLHLLLQGRISRVAIVLWLSRVTTATIGGLLVKLPTRIASVVHLDLQGNELAMGDLVWLVSKLPVSRLHLRLPNTLPSQHLDLQRASSAHVLCLS